MCECVYVSVCWSKGQAVYGNCTFAQFSWKLKTAGKKIIKNISFKKTQCELIFYISSPPKNVTENTKFCFLFLSLPEFQLVSITYDRSIQERQAFHPDENKMKCYQILRS